MNATARVATSRIQSYWVASRAPRYSLLFALPLLVCYEVLGVALSSGDQRAQVRNGADVLLKELSFMLLGAYGPLVLMGGIVAICLVLVWRDTRRAGGPFRGRVFGGMLLESATLAMLFGLVVGTMTAQLLGHLRPLAIGPIEGLDPATRVMLSLGAGLYEELLFRVILVGTLATGARLLLGLRARAAGVLATVVGALAFSAFHYIGPYGEPLQLQSFVYRAISGVAFSTLYLTRGFGITAWTHALYDLSVMVL